MNSATSPTRANTEPRAATERTVVEGTTRQRLVAAAVEVFTAHGYNTRVQDIAERAGFTSGALYVHFPNRAELLDEAISTEASRLIAVHGCDVAVDARTAHLILEGLTLHARTADSRMAAALEHQRERLGGHAELTRWFGAITSAALT